MKEHEAKNLFFEYGGNHGLMASDGMYKQYLKYGVSRAIELEWSAELIGLLGSHFEAVGVVDDEIIKLVRLIRNFGRCDALESLILTAKRKWPRLDDFTKILILELFVDAVKVLRQDAWRSQVRRDNIIEMMRGLSVSLGEGPYIIGKYYKTKEYLHSALSDESVCKRMINLREAVDKLK